MKFVQPATKPLSDPPLYNDRGDGGFRDGCAPSANVAFNSIAAPQAENTLGVVRPDPMLAKSQFLKQLHLEKRRADRSKMPLSIVTVELDRDSSRDVARVREMAQMLLAGGRETDIHGDLGDGQMAMLLPHTGAEGAQAVARSLQDRAGGLSLSITVATYPDHIFDSLAAGRAPEHDSDPLLLHGISSASQFDMVMKRLVDVVGSITLLFLTFPLMLTAAIAVAATSRGPVIFRQIRLGRLGAPFVCYKFRSMRIDADDQIHRDYVAKLIDGKTQQVNQGDSDEPHYKIKADPRVTTVGRFIRATSIDELPQLLNVLKGDMSLVGPRPPLQYEAEKYQSWHLRRVLEIRPGITGLWQVEGRSKTSFDDMVRLDLRYSREWSLWLDVKILAKTVVVVLGRHGAA